MTNLLIITQRVDEDDDLLGFFVGWLREFSKKFDKVFVITLAKGKYELPDNVFVYSLGKEKNNPKISRPLKFYWYLFKLIPKIKGIFVHMSPIFVIMSWPVAVIFGRKIILWYLHRSVTKRLKLAEKLCYKIATSTAESLNIKSKKIVEVGHGIDVDRFKTGTRQTKSGALKILSVGRISKIKNYETLIKAVAILRDKGLRFKVKIVGRTIMDYDLDYFEELKKMVKDLGLENLIEFIGFVPYSGIADYYKEADIFINLTPKGGVDKAVLEAMASGCIAFVSNEVFEKYFGDFRSSLIFKHGDANSLADKILSISKLPDERIKEISRFLEESVSTDHNLSNTISRISYLFNP